MKATTKQRRIIFAKYDGKCAYCGCKLETGWHVDHIEPVVRDLVFVQSRGKYESAPTAGKPENHTLENMNPACPSCNLLKSSMTIEQFRAVIQNFKASLNRYALQYKFAKKFGLIKETRKKVQFHFEKTIGKSKNKNSPPSSEFEQKDRCPSCGSYCNVFTDLDEKDYCNECRV